MNILVTGGCGFIGSHVVDTLIKRISGNDKIVIMDSLSYAAGHTKYVNYDKSTHPEIAKKVEFFYGDIANYSDVATVATMYNITHVINLAAETHVDNSIKSSHMFVHSNVNGTHTLLDFFNQFWKNRSNHMMVHVSTDEVFGDLGPEDPKFVPNSPYKPSSPYSATKAASDHLCKAWYRTYGFPVIVTNCSNNFGPRQHSEKMIPTVIRKIFNHEEIPVYGDGTNVRDWIYVEDHAECLWNALIYGKAGEQYLIGGNNELSNNDLVTYIQKAYEKIVRDAPPAKIKYVTDRPGHDRRYAIDCSKTMKELKWEPSKDFQRKILITFQWYLENKLA